VTPVRVPIRGARVYLAEVRDEKASGGIRETLPACHRILESHAPLTCMYAELGGWQSDGVEG
jgi:hypothetical protein